MRTAALVVVSQGFVWSAILAGRLALYFWGELGGAVLIAANAVASAALYPGRHVLGDAAVFLYVHMLFGALYLAWQVLNLRLQSADARAAGETLHRATRVSRERLAEGLRRALRDRHPTTDAVPWGGLVGLTWMAGYFATLLPPSANLIVGVLAR